MARLFCKSKGKLGHEAALTEAAVAVEVPLAVAYLALAYLIMVSFNMAIVQKAYQISVLNESKREMQWNVRNAMGQKRNAEELNRMRKCNGYVKLEM